MKTFDFALWLPVLAILLGAIGHSLSADGGASILVRFGIEARLPAKALPVLVLVVSVGAGVADDVLAGQDLQHAAVMSIEAAVASVFGIVTNHAQGTSGAAILLVVVGVFAGGAEEGCQLFTPENLPKTEQVAEEITKDALCAAEHAFVDNATLNTVCGLLTPQRQLAAHEIARAQREQVGKRMAAMRAEACGDAGSQ
jgi:hypothetical protein